jgi:hypothetical protein
VKTTKPILKKRRIPNYEILFFVSALILTFSIQLIFDGTNNKKEVTRQVMVYDPDTGPSADIGNYWETLSVPAYRRRCYMDATLGIVISGLIFRSAWRQRKERIELERSWANFLFYPDNREDVEKRPHLFNDEFLEHVKRSKEERDSRPPEGSG